MRNVGDTKILRGISTLPPELVASGAFASAQWPVRRTGGSRTAITGARGSRTKYLMVIRNKHPDRHLTPSP
jgi:hypothetical protein